MIKFKSIIALMLVLVMSISLVACGNDTNETVSPPDTEDATGDTVETPPEPVDEQGKVLNIWGWNNEFQGLFETYFVGAGLLPDDIEVKFTIVPNDDNAYQNALDEALLNQDNASDDNKIDLFLVEADYALKYVDSDYTLDIINDVGLTQGDISGQYTYTQEIVTDSNGSIKGSSWQEALSTWDKFYDVAEMASSKGYKMLSGYDDSYRTFSNNMSNPWVDSSNTIVLDDNIVKWIEQTKEFTDNGYNNRSSLWDDQWAADQGPGGKVFGFFYSTWGINFTLLGNALDTPLPEGVTATGDPDAFREATEGNGIFGDYGVVEGPQNYYWGGSWLCAAAGSDNLDLVQEIMRTMTCDKDTLTTITKDTQDFTNNIEAMEILASDDNFASAFLGGQNHINLFAESAKGIDMSNISPYDQGLNEEVQTAFRDYFNGTVDYDTALNNFYTAAIEKYPNLNIPN